MDDRYTNCETCGVTILHRTHERHGGLCKSCYDDSQLRNIRPEPNPEQRDPVETTGRYLEIVAGVDQSATRAAINHLRERCPHLDISADDLPMGFCHLFWRKKKRILKDDHNIDWKTPAELNPHIFYD